jgi:hypothetical protein
MIGARGAARFYTVVAAGIFMAVATASAGGCGFLKPKKRAFAEACSSDTDCESLDCAAQGNICTKACTYNKECGGDYVCRQKDDGTADHCATAVGAAPNGTCMEPSDCQNGHCLKHVGEETSPGICSRYCTGPDDCPDGMKICDSISDTGTLKMCLPGAAGTPATARPVFRPAPKATVKVPVPVATVTAPTGTQTVTGPSLTARTSLPPASAAPTVKPTAPATKPTAVPIKPRH